MPQLEKVEREEPADRVVPRFRILDAQMEQVGEEGKVGWHGEPNPLKAGKRALSSLRW